MVAGPRDPITDWNALIAAIGAATLTEMVRWMPMATYARATLVMSALLIVAIVVYLLVEQRRDVCDAPDREFECSFVCHPEEIYARRILRTMTRIPMTLQTCANLAAEVAKGGTMASVRSCVGELGQADTDALRAFTDISKKLVAPSAQLIASWQNRCEMRQAPIAVDAGALPSRDAGAAPPGPIVEQNLGHQAKRAPSAPSTERAHLEHRTPGELKYRFNHPDTGPIEEANR